LLLVLFAGAILDLHAANKPRPKTVASKAKSGASVANGDFHGWPAIVLRNRSAEVVIVPAIGRVMQFNLRDAKGEGVRGPLWNNPAIGKELKPDSEGWTNYGGDKSWPAPQSEWPSLTGSGWPPPKGFDATPYTASVKGSAVELVSDIDPSYGVRVRRTISLDPHKPVMKIDTVYEKVEGVPIRVAVWTITQLGTPDRAFMLLPAHSAFPQGYRSFMPGPPRDLRIDGRLLSVTRNPEKDTLIGSDGVAVLWVGDGPDLLIKSVSSHPPAGAAEWPDNGSHNKIYTNAAEELQYVELELLGPLHHLKPGDRASTSNTYSLIRRTKPDAVAEAKKVFAQP
jgi:hypothetical protein